MNPYWQFLENSSRMFFEISFPEHELDGITRTGKFIHLFEISISGEIIFCQISGHELDRTMSG